MCRVSVEYKREREGRKRVRKERIGRGIGVGNLSRVHQGIARPENKPNDTYMEEERDRQGLRIDGVTALIAYCCTFPADRSRVRDIHPSIQRVLYQPGHRIDFAFVYFIPRYSKYSSYTSTTAVSPAAAQRRSYQHRLSGLLRSQDLKYYMYTCVMCNIFCLVYPSTCEPLAPPSDPHPNLLRSLPDPAARVGRILSADFMIVAPPTHTYLCINNRSQSRSTGADCR